MNSHYIFIYFLPLLISLILSGPIRFSERVVTRLASLSLLLPALISFYIFISDYGHALPFEYDLARFSMFGHTFPLIIWIDRYTLAMLCLTHILGLLVVKYSHGYLHLEKGFQRFFGTICFFIFGMYLLSMAGTLDLFFAGWEVVGFSSFLLIAFYRSHNRSVQNAWRIYNIYRICDIGLLLGAVVGHVLWHEATRFSVLSHLTNADFEGVKATTMLFISLFVIFASLGKSAQFPFHNWPSRAMEGPTPSSAIFYGALSVHAGVFLLIRTYPIWSHTTSTQILVGCVGLTTLIISSFQGSVQANIKGQIAFASTAQIGLMFIELAFGLVDLAMVHLFCHALYRCFQMLVSPSIVLNSLGQNNKIVMRRIAGKKLWKEYLPLRLRNTLYLLSMTEFSMDISWRGFNFIPWKKSFNFLSHFLGKPIVLTPFLLAIYIYAPHSTRLAWIFSLTGVWFAIQGLLAHNDPLKPMRDLTFSIILAMVAVYVLDSHYIDAISSYMYSVAPCLLIATYITTRFQFCDLRNFHGQGTAHPFMANCFLICFMIVAGMPVSSAFLGEDIIIADIIAHSPLMAGVVAFSLMINGLIFVKIYTRLFMGLAPAVKVRR